MTAIILATMLEAEFAICEFGFDVLCESPFKIFKKGEVLLAISGIGNVNSALCANFILQNFDVEKVVNMGACGILNKDFSMSEIYEVGFVKSADFAQKDVFEISKNGAILISSSNPIKSDSEREKFAKIADLVDMECYGILQALKTSNFDLRNFKAIKLTSDFSENCDIKKNISKTISKLSPKIKELL